MTRLLDWLDDRTGVRGITRAALYEHVPGGARWRYVWGSTLLFTFGLQLITGFFLWSAYSPSSQTAWESVYYIQHEMAGGAVLRGIHHYTAQVMIVLLALHMLQVIIDGAYRAPREVNFWIGLILLMIVLGLSLTGYLLPWDQKGYWSTQVATSLLSAIPGIGESLQRLVIGGPNYGHHTLTRFFALHAGLLPFLMMLFIGVHVYVFRRHGLRHKLPARGPDTHFWPDQVLKDAVACLGVLLVVLLLVFRFYIVPGGSHHIGAELYAPAEPTEQFTARPEWYFLFLFQFLKLPYFAAENEFLGAVVIPGIIFLLLFLMPIVGRWRVGHAFNVALTMFLAAGMVLLTVMAVVEDAGGPKLNARWLAPLAGPTVSIAWFSVLLLASLVLVPIFSRERSFKFNAIVLGSLLGLVVIASLAVMASGDDGAARPSVRLGQMDVPVQALLLLGLLAAQVLVLTVALFLDYPHAGEVGDAPAPISLGRWELHHRTRIGLLMAVIAATVFLTATSLVGTQGKPDYGRSVQLAQADARRVVELAGSPGGIPVEGAVWLLRHDAKTQGPRLFAQYCASCHGFNGTNGAGVELTEAPSAPDLAGFASREWLAGLLDPARVDSSKYFGPSMKAHAGDMVGYVKDDVVKLDEKGRTQLVSAIKALSAEAQLPAQAATDAADAKEIADARKFIGTDGLACTDCHNYRGQKGKGGPDLNGYGSREWMMGIITNPAHSRFYGKDNDRMPAFGEDKLLTPEQIGLVADWIRGDWYEKGRAVATKPVTTQTAPETKPVR